ncbi:MAG TPA: SDR family oxidoreductase [Rhizomicrobium sp.]|nr:SDR family oxidoreductase [Rhizomicrobium sp.]
MSGKANGRKSIFITGAASGIGRATAVLFAGHGWFVGAFDVNEQGLATLTQEIGGGNCVTGRLDVTAKENFEAAVAAFGAETDGHMDVLFNNAGIGESGWFEDVPYESALRVVQVNLVGVLTGIYTALPLLKATKNSLCFTTSSSSATYGMPRLAVYSATKHAVKGLTEALSIEFARHGIRVADTLPGLIDTAILRNTPNRSDGRAPDETETMLANAPKKGPFRLMPPGAVAEAVWAAYGSDKLHWYVPPEIAWIDRIKGFSPETIRKRIKKLTSGVIKTEKPD